MREALMLMALGLSFWLLVWQVAKFAEAVNDG